MKLKEWIQIHLYYIYVDIDTVDVYLYIRRKPPSKMEGGTDKTRQLDEKARRGEE